MTQPDLPRSGAGPEARAPLAWDRLLSQRIRSASLERAARLSRVPLPAGSIDLASQQPAPDLIPHEDLAACLDHVLSTHGGRCLGYGENQGRHALRAAIAGELAGSGIVASPDDIVVTSGSQQALDLLIRVLVDPGDAFLVETATYPGTLHLLEVAGGRVVEVRWDAEGPALADLRTAAGLRPKGLYVMPSCHNPVGTCFSAGRREALVAWSHEAGVPLVEDDYDADLDLDGKPMPPRLRALDADVCHVGTFSKKLIPALRVGYLVCPPAIRAKVVALKTDQDNGTSDLLQHALAEFLARGCLRAHLARVLPAYRARRDALEAALRAVLPATFAWRHPTRGLFLWLPLPDGLSADAVHEEARRRGVQVLPTSLYTSAGTSAEEGIRLTFCREPADRLAEGARRLAAAIDAVAQRSRISPAARRPEA